MVIASDVNPPPRSVRSLASNFGCKLYYPESSLTNVEKIEIARGFRIKDDHERDALAASIKAFKKYRDLFERVDDVLGDLELKDIFEEVIMKLVREDSENIIDTINEIMERRSRPEVATKKIRSPGEYEELIKKLQRNIAKRYQEINFLKKSEQSLREQLVEMKKELRYRTENIIGSKEIENLNRKILLMRQDIKNLKDINIFLKRSIKIESKGLVPIVEIKEIERDILDELDENIGLEDKVILIRSNKNIEMLNGYGIKALVCLEKIPESVISRLEFPLVDIKTDDINVVEGIKVISKQLLEDGIRISRKEGFVKWLERYRERKE